MARRERERERKRVPQFVYRGRSNIVRRECKVSEVEGTFMEPSTGRDHYFTNTLQTALSAQRSGRHVIHSIEAT